ncbi:hypothetical protein ABEB36_015633 [Hypothenemus hampei]|uniref:Uncharacterized protein n=1 Tax=Hypothenemus hampei TaxID=57062 RepID=A0ABD1E175_HYPHA
MVLNLFLVICNFCQEKIFARNSKHRQLCSRCIECDNIILDNFNHCECCGLETERKIRINKAKKLQEKFKSQFLKTIETSSKTITDSSITFENSQNLFDDFQITYEELEKLEKSLVLSSEKMNYEELKKPEESFICSFDKINFEDLNRLEECKELESGSGKKSLVDKKKRKRI